MTNSPDYRMFLENEFSHIRSELSEIKVQVTQTNGTVRQHEKYIQYADDVIESRGKETEEIVRRLDQLDTDLLEWRFFKKYPKVGFGLVAVIVIGILVSAYGSFRSIKNATLVKDLKTEVDMINTPVRTRGGAIEWWPSGVVIDSMKKDSVK